MIRANVHGKLFHIAWINKVFLEPVIESLDQTVCVSRNDVTIRNISSYTQNYDASFIGETSSLNLSSNVASVKTLSVFPCVLMITEPCK